ncbi:unnamed protein product [Paramecium primaurelia]|uniref:Ubiquitin-like protease family profile domain-containing protein n=1 Tax=Paramecium primaurelia TaxID=5886 RepID=A0A8S1QD79_PARPR|nr:unnamed protein product [Paramecium primaurelia]
MSRLKSIEQTRQKNKNNLNKDQIYLYQLYQQQKMKVDQLQNKINIQDINRSTEIYQNKITNEHNFKLYKEIELERRNNNPKPKTPIKNSIRKNKSFYKNSEQPDLDNNKNKYINKQRQLKGDFQIQEQPKINTLIDIFYQHGYDVINISNNSEYEKLLIFTNILFYDKDQQNIEIPSQQRVCLFKIKGKLYQTIFDDNNNPKYQILEGEFLVDLNKNTFQLDGQGIENQGKSNQIKNQGEYRKGVYVQRIPYSENKSTYKSYSVEPKRIKILEIVDGQPIHVNKKNDKKTIWCKYNQQFGINDLMILNTTMWLNSSIIDCYVLHLNKISQEEYFKLSLDQRQQINRIYFVTSSLITNFGKFYHSHQNLELFKQHFLELQEIKFEIQTIYSKIGFPINQNKHWYFLLFDLKEKKVEIFNSLLSFNHDNSLINYLSELLMLKNPQLSKSSISGQQKDGYSCGYHVCQFMKTCWEASFLKSTQYQYNEKIMKTFLKDLIKDEENKQN